MRIAFLSLALLAASAFAAPPPIDIPAEIRPAGQYITLTPATTAVALDYVGLDGLEPLPPSLLKDVRMFVLDTRGLAKGRYRFIAVGASGTGELARAAFAVVIGDAPPPGPGPGPVPPPPDDPLLPTLRAIYGADQSPTKQADVKALAAIFRESAAVADDTRLTTYRQVNDAVASVTMRAVPLPRLSPLREVVRGEFVKQFGDVGEQALTPELRGKLKGQFVRVAELFTELAK
jgi:hypothetical protein